MNEFDSYTNGFEIGSRLSGDYIRILDEKKRRIFMEEQYKFLQVQKAEILAQQKYREKQSKSANFEKRLLIFNTAIAIAALLVSLFK